MIPAKEYEITAEQIKAIGTGSGDPSRCADTRIAQLLALQNTAEVLKAIAVVLVDIRDENRAEHEEQLP